MRRWLTILSCALCSAGCGTSGSLALDEPVRVRGGTFHEGALPGSEPSPDDMGDVLRVTSLESVNNLAFPGQSGARVSGRATGDTFAIGLRFAELGTGYWVVPVGGEDPAAPGELIWSASLEYAADLPYGLLPIRVVAIGNAGQAGHQRALTVCSVPIVPDNFHACSEDIAPPAYVVTLSWDANVDLDLVVLTPEGKRVDGKHPTTALLPEGEAEIPDDIVVDPSTGILDRDSFALCEPDGFRRESLVWQGEPRPGTYWLYADLHDSCGAPGAAFRLAVYVRPAQREDGSWPLQEVIREVEGDVVAGQADGGDRLGTYLTAITFGE